MSLQVTGLVKTFNGVPALGGVDLHVPAGQVHALLGHNGAGKSTLIKCLGGAFAPDSGSIDVNGVPHARLTPRTAIAAGVAIIYQNLSVIEPLTAAENIFLGQEWTRAGLVNRHAQHEAATGLLRRVGASCRADDRVGDLPMGQRQMVEIAKALSRSASVLVLDEPTAALSTAESTVLAECVDELRGQGLAVVYVTHLLAEVQRLADAVTVLRDGLVSHRSTRPARDRSALVAAIAGTSGAPVAPLTADVPAAGPPRLEVDGLAGPGFGPVSLTVGAGEIVGLYGLIGSGRTRLIETMFGRRRRSRGTVRIDGRTITPRNPADALAEGVALVPADRRRQGLFGLLSALDNMLLPALRPLARHRLRHRRAERRLFTDTATALRLRPAAPRAPATAFSGGNQQKLLLGRWINRSRTTNLLLLDEPTQGVDVGSRREIYQAVADLAAGTGAAVLFASTDPEEIVALAHRCLVIVDGRVSAELSGARLTEAALLSAAHLAPTSPDERRTR
ncbi:sugar ABC transporter ATP-binding protein [Actinoplanes sp. NPDC026670]|uniref:sugar ABC transporter ATP-binding protein n=1 Tax=Actinoplanes sp. NPDC026670 TaxID=3154700 RepID=UPI0033C87088